ncbi:MAG: SprB repeat-containing protein [Cyclobacteriaceae bacterium]|nr:SprB repeat-containing protein [Cyclobacteriaceae bacterium]
MMIRDLKTMLGLGCVMLLLIYSGCSSNNEPKPVDCNTTDLGIALSTKSNPTGCGTIDGSIAVTASGGMAPYQFKLNSGVLVSTSTFSNLGPGTFNVVVKDSNGCERELSGVILTAPSAPSAGIPVLVSQTNCSSPNGSITLNVSGGTPPYQYQLGDGSFGSSSAFANLKAGNYTITIKDASNCIVTVNGTVASQTSVSFANDIAPILQANCIKSGCHNGDNGADRNWSVFANVQTNALNIKTRTGNKSMPKDIAPTGLPQAQIDLIACWVDSGALNN